MITDAVALFASDSAKSGEKLAWYCVISLVWPAAYAFAHVFLYMYTCITVDET